MLCQTVGELMTTDVVSVPLDASLERIREIFESKRFHHVVVTDDRRVRGVISDRDLLKHISPFIGHELMERSRDLNTLKKRAHQIMHREPVVARVDMPSVDATRLLLNHGVTCLPVVNELDRLVGIVTWRDLLTHCIDDSCRIKGAA